MPHLMVLLQHCLYFRLRCQAQQCFIFDKDFYKVVQYNIVNILM